MVSLPFLDGKEAVHEKKLWHTFCYLHTSKDQFTYVLHSGSADPTCSVADLNNRSFTLLYIYPNPHHIVLQSVRVQVSMCEFRKLTVCMTSSLNSVTQNIEVTCVPLALNMSLFSCNLLSVFLLEVDPSTFTHLLSEK